MGMCVCYIMPVLSGVKRDAKKAITTFAVTVDDKAYSYPKDSCPK